jgi:hypothetical protein
VLPFITVTTSALVNGLPTVALCPVPLVSVIDIVGGGGVELELPPPPQLVRQPKARQTKPRMLA